MANILAFPSYSELFCIYKCVKNTSGKKRSFRICARYARVVGMSEIEGVSSGGYLSISTEPKVNNR